MKRVIGILIMIGLLTVAFTPLTIAQKSLPNTKLDPPFVDVYMSPRNPIGADWTTGLNGDVITIFANVTDNYLSDGVWINWRFCNRVTCVDSPGDFLMTHVAGTLYKYVMPGDSINGWPYYDASGDPLQYVRFWLYADSYDLSGGAFYPGPDSTHHIYIYPAFQPKQTNATSTLSKTTMWTGESFWINGTSNCWNSSSYPDDNSKLLPCDEWNVAVKVGPTTFNGKTNIWGNYSVQVTAPAAPGSYTVNTTVSNATANRNVPCKSANQTITVNAYPFVDEVSIGLSDNSVYPGDLVTVSGNAKYDTGTPVQTTKAYVNFSSTSHTVSTNAAGDYSKQINAPMAPGIYPVTATVVDQLYLGTKKSNNTNLNVETPTMDVTISPNSTTPYPNTKIWVQGTATYGNGLPVMSGAVNVSIVEVSALYNNSVTTNALGNYLAQITVPNTVGPFHIDANVTGANYGGVTGNVQEEIIVCLVPTPDLRASDTGLAFNETTGNYLEGHTVKITLNVTNTGSAAASDVLVNFTSWTNQTTYLGSDNITLLNNGTYSIVEFDWIAIEGNHTINATVDPMNTIEEALETNNKASMVLFIDGDADRDDVGNLADMDDDNDGYNDTTENDEGSDPLDNSSTPADIDQDFIPDSMDEDMDGDGFNNTADVFPDDPAEWSDLDGDNIGDNGDPDVDGDGIENDDDMYPENPAEWYDTDGDGTGNNADSDDDNDTFPDTWEEFLGNDPLDNQSTPTDTDLDGIPDGNSNNTEIWMDTDDDGDYVADVADLFPLDGTESADADSDGIGNNADTDDDADGLSDASTDPYPNDTDNDGLANNMDSDDDNDGIMDTEDTMPLDSDNDSQNNDIDSDDDGDSVADAVDDFPLDPAASVDTDGDGMPDTWNTGYTADDSSTGLEEDADDDDDGVLDVDDEDPLDPAIGEAESGSNTLVIAAVVIVVIVVVVLLAYMFVIRPKMK